LALEEVDELVVSSPDCWRSCQCNVRPQCNECYINVQVYLVELPSATHSHRNDALVLDCARAGRPFKWAVSIKTLPPRRLSLLCSGVW